MAKTFKEYRNYIGGYRLGNYDNITPIASLGDVPPKGQGGKDSRGVGLHASASKKADELLHLKLLAHFLYTSKYNFIVLSSAILSVLFLIK